MAEDRLLRVLTDREVLLEAYAASSAYVLRRVYESVRELQAFRGKAALAPAILRRLVALTRAPGPKDAVVIGAHLYALELAGSRPEVRKAVAAVLREPALKEDLLLGQLAGRIGQKLITKPDAPLPAAEFRSLLDRKALDEITRTLGKEGDGE